MTDPGGVVRRHIEAFNARDRDAEPWSATAEFVAPGAAISGREQVLDFVSAFQEAFPDGRLALKQLLVDGDAAAVEGAFVGTHEGVLRTPGGEVAATGRRVDFRWAAVYRVDGDELVSEHLFFDQLELLGQLGRAPT
jgi:predicted ester cyclase